MATELLDANQHQNNFALIAIALGYNRAVARGDDQSLVVSDHINSALPTNNENARYNFKVHTKGAWGTGDEIQSPTLLTFYLANTDAFNFLADMRFETGNTVSGDYAIPMWWKYDAMYLSKDGKTSFFDAEIWPTWVQKHG